MGSFYFIFGLFGYVIVWGVFGEGKYFVVGGLGSWIVSWVG